MDLRQLRYFVGIVESGSVTRASRQLCIAQPALSAQLSKLEAEVGAAHHGHHSGDRQRGIRYLKHVAHDRPGHRRTQASR